MNSILIVSPVRAASTWLNLAMAKHLNLYNVGESLCKISPALLMDYAGVNNRIVEGGQQQSHFINSMKDMFDQDFRKLSKEDQMKKLKSTPFIAKFTPWDLYDANDKQYADTYGYGYDFDKFREDVKPLTTIFLYRRNLVEHFISFINVHRTGIMNTTSPFINYQRPKMKYLESEKEYYLGHKHMWEKCYKEHGHKFDHTITYEELFKMDELCGVPLKQYHDQFTLKLNHYTKEELDEARELTGLEEDYEIC